jgi:hypothetical protein
MTVENFDLTFPEVDAEKEKELTAASQRDVTGDFCPPTNDER